MNTGEVGILSAIVTILTLVISKLVELATTKLKLRSESKARHHDFFLTREAQSYDEFKESLKNEIAKLKQELDSVQDSNIDLRVENARLNIVNEQLNDTLERLTAANAALEAEIAELKRYHIAFEH